jgi:hypothetical protein
MTNGQAPLNDFPRHRRPVATRVARAVGRHLGWAALAVTVVGAAGTGAVGWAIRDGMLTIAAGSPRAALTRTASRTMAPSRDAAVLALRKACAMEPRSADEVHEVIETLAEGRAAGVPGDAGRSVTVLAVSGGLADRFPAAASMTMVGGRGVLTWNQEAPGNGSTVYHELVHLGQFRLGPSGQRRLLDELRRVEPLPAAQAGFTERDAFDAWKSVHTVLTYGRTAEATDSLADAVVRESKALRSSMPSTPVARVVRAAGRVLADSAWSSARDRLALVAWLHEGAPPSRPPEGWTWHDELERLTYFEAMAYAADRRCRTEARKVD